MFWVIYQDCGSIVIPELAFSTYGEAYTEITNGEYGEGYVRFGLIENEHRTRQALRGIKKVLRAGLPSDWKAE